jgi:hypothetical protein
LIGGIEAKGRVGTVSSWSTIITVAKYTYGDYAEEQAAKKGIEVKEYLDPRGWGGNWGFNAPEFDPNHYQEISVPGGSAFFETDDTKLESENSSLVGARMNGDGTITTVTRDYTTGVVTETKFAKTPTGVYTPVGVLEVNVASGGYEWTGNTWGDHWADPRTNVERPLGEVWPAAGFVDRPLS